MASSDISLTVSHHIKEWRKHRKLTGKEVGDRCLPKPLTSSMITQLEKGRSGYTQRSLENIARVLDVEPWQLLYSEPLPTLDWIALRGALREAQVLVDERDRHWIEGLFMGALKTAIEATRHIVRERGRTEEEAA